MLLNEAFFAIKDLVGIQFKDIFSESKLEDIIKNKGKSGQILELAIGLKNTNKKQRLKAISCYIF